MPHEILLVTLLVSTVTAYRGQEGTDRRQWSLSQVASFSSPEFVKLLPALDAEMRPIESVKVPDHECLQMVDALASAHVEMERPGMIHTGIILPPGAQEVDPSWVDTARKLRLLPLSFLATQDLRKTKLYFWVNAGATHPLIREIFEPLLEQYGEYIEIKTFDAATEIGKLCQNYSADNATSLTSELVKIYESQEIVASRSDLMRAVLLFNYGGAWMDSDVILVQDLAPILEQDWAVLMYANFVNPATLSVSRPASPFIRAWLANILALGVNKGWAAYGPFMITRMTAEIQRSVANATFHVLPPCFFEGALSMGAHFSDQTAPIWDDFFSQKLEKSLRSQNYIDPTVKRHSTFGYHWHNRWDKKIVDGSVADAAEKLYCNWDDFKLDENLMGGFQRVVFSVVFGVIIAFD